MGLGPLLGSSLPEREGSLSWPVLGPGASSNHSLSGLGCPRECWTLQRWELGPRGHTAPEQERVPEGGSTRPGLGSPPAARPAPDLGSALLRHPEPGPAGREMPGRHVGDPVLSQAVKRGPLPRGRVKPGWAPPPGHHHLGRDLYCSWTHRGSGPLSTAPTSWGPGGGP